MSESDRIEMVSLRDYELDAEKKEIAKGIISLILYEGIVIEGSPGTGKPWL